MFLELLDDHITKESKHAVLVYVWTFGEKALYLFLDTQSFTHEVVYVTNEIY